MTWVEAAGRAAVFPAGALPAAADQAAVFPAGAGQAAVGMAAAGEDTAPVMAVHGADPAAFMVVPHAGLDPATTTIRVTTITADGVGAEAIGVRAAGVVTAAGVAVVWAVCRRLLVSAWC